ncbi:MAG TPA: RNA polymerase sporulation sigma factor SigH [Actinomycetota bacterium]|nr:RNA polymerase sporulation sigma factor SigH [Actinomycetota bacterium]
MSRRSTIDVVEDVELLERAREGSERDLEELINRYRNLARSKARSYFMAGAGQDDLVQEAMIGLFKAARDFDPAQETPFSAFAELCITRQILTAIKMANRMKHQPLNASVSLDVQSSSNGEEWSPLDLLPSSGLSDPAELVVCAEEIDDIRESLRTKLTSLESEVLRLYMDKKSYEEIALTLGNHVKSVDNALQRIKRKLKTHLTERDAQHV